jgi:hypothetical protein
MIGKTSWKGGKALKLSNESAELVVPLEYGPRVLRGGLKGGPNLFLELEEKEPIAPASPEFKLRGGHRLWHAPEEMPRTYQPDNVAPALKRTKGREEIVLTTEAEQATGIVKSLGVEVLKDGFRITHTLRNAGLWPVELAPWALTMFRGGGVGVVPLLPKGSHAKGDLLPTYTMVPWSYTDFALSCWKFHPSFIGIEVALAPHAQKLGLSNYPGWSAYWFEGTLFVKHAKVIAGATYPDLGCAFETFTNGSMIELETLGPIGPLAPGASVTHVEEWTFIADVPRPDSEAAYVRGVLPAVSRWLRGR